MSTSTDDKDTLFSLAREIILSVSELKKRLDPYPDLHKSLNPVDFINEQYREINFLPENKDKAYLLSKMLDLLYPRSQQESLKWGYKDTLYLVLTKEQYQLLEPVIKEKANS